MSWDEEAERAYEAERMRRKRAAEHAKRMAAAHALLPPAPADTSWEEWSLCAEVGPDVFYPPEPLHEDDAPRRHNGSYAAVAKRICAGCPVIEECLNTALHWEVDEDTGRPLTDGYRFGVWGGMDPAQRARYALAYVAEKQAA